MIEANPSDTPSDREAGRSDANGLTRRAFLGSVGGVAVGAGALAAGLRLSSSNTPTAGGAYRNAVEPFYGVGPQGGITTTAQSNTYLAAFDLSTPKRSEVRDILRIWTDVAANLTAGKPAAPFSTSERSVESDSMDAVDLGPARLTLTFGFGPGLFEKDGEDRYGLRSRRPKALVDLPQFPGDQLVAAKTGGDLTVQACADDPQVAFHAVRELARQASSAAAIRWTQSGFNESAASVGTPRNLMGFKDGTINPAGSQLDEFVWVGPEGPGWMQGGSYLVVRRIRIALEHWDSQPLAIQEQVIGRHKLSGAPFGGTSEFAALDLKAKDPSGVPLIPMDAHVRLAAPQLYHGQMILRRSYAYNDGVADFPEQFPPWHQAFTYDAGLVFAAYQRDPRKGFIPIFQSLAQNDALSQFTAHTGSVIVAIPPAALGPGHFVGEGLFA
jgi:deferrochelatase/peroxidase EfeB